MPSGMAGGMVLVRFAHLEASTQQNNSSSFSHPGLAPLGGLGRALTTQDCTRLERAVHLPLPGLGP